MPPRPPPAPPAAELPVLRRAELAIRRWDSQELGGVLAGVRTPLDLGLVPSSSPSSRQPPQQPGSSTQLPAPGTALDSLTGFSLLHLAALNGSTNCLRVLLAHRRLRAAAGTDTAAAADGGDVDSPLGDLLNNPASRPWSALGAPPALSDELPSTLRNRRQSSEARRLAFAAAAQHPPTEPNPALAASGCSVLHFAVLSCCAECIDFVGEEEEVDLAWMDEARLLRCFGSFCSCACAALACFWPRLCFLERETTASILALVCCAAEP